MVNDRRSISWKKHATALIITALIFTIGILIGIRVSDERISYTQDEIQKQKLDYESLQLQVLSLTQESSNCDLVLTTLERNIYTLEEARIKLENYIEGSDDNFDLIKREYMLTEIRYWLIAQQAKDICGVDVVSVLYFYKHDNSCKDCSTQGHILTFLKNKFKDKLLIFSLDMDNPEPMVQLLKETYNVDQSPSLVIEDEMAPGLVTKEKLVEILCKYYKEKTEICEDDM